MSERDSEFVFSPVHVTVVHQEHDELVEEAVTYACDFCMDTRVVWDYPCKDFTIDEIGFGSQGEWCACARCAEFIEQKQLPALTLRTIRSQIARRLPMDGDEIAKYGRIQQGFFDHQDGPRKPHVP